MKKKMISFAAVLGLMTLVGCSSTDSSSKSDGDTDKVKVEVFNIKTETAEQMEELVEKFETAHPEIDINMTTVGGGTDADAALQAKFSSGDEPALFMIGGLAGAQTWEHTLYDLGETELANLAIEGTLEGATLNEKVLGVPMNIEGYGWLINKVIFEEAGIDTTKITSFEDFKKAIETLDAKKDELGLKGVFAYSGGETWVSGQYSSNFIAPEFNNSLKETSEAKKLELTYSDRWQAYTDLAIKYNATPLESMDYSTSVEELFASGKAAIIHQGNWIVPTLNSLDETFAKDKLDILPMFVDEKEEGNIVAGPAWYWCVNDNKDQEVIDASIEFLKWMYTDDEGMQMIVNDFGFIPPYTNFESKDISDPLSSTIYQYLNDGNAVPWVHNSYPDGYPLNVVGVEIQSYAGKQTNWEEFKEILSTKWAEERTE
ncbi:raffinose/stachyose/melibiose transport system substrate-binding protein [Enterococcus sp. PF1-24]|uniref:ABC transporter substrate-binding protein n=1 Tax=unclassified Enterococcus TaxID=2608891 RepID=UPI0024759282|nr:MULTISPECIES: ABC transporter substrate-binding protein [unclassified Enterococcus]MDH6365337.1 raffinose/stachyose/melibiose transport system substrate-binding protein [Enterococcus sp. PFB1-1]MDH6402407.1 raffinose/stachyose/melibiose transport system substrate-binding protein [Enterococcus sp. PF1-24]